MDRFDELVVLTTIFDAGSLAGAARRLRRSAPSVTRSLAALEQRVGMRLVERTTRRLSPTEAGRRLTTQARKLLADYGDAIGDISRQRETSPLEGVLRVTAPILFGRLHVVPLVGSFLDTYPGIRIELVLGGYNLDLVGEGLDVAVRIGPLTESGLVARRVGRVRLVTYASPDYLARQGRPRTPRDLLKQDIVFISGLPAPFEWRFRRAGRSHVVRFTPRLVVTEVEAGIEAVSRGRGIGRSLSYQVADHFASESLVRLLADFEPPPLPVQLVIPSTRHMLPSVRAFLDHVARGLDDLPVIHE